MRILRVLAAGLSLAAGVVVLAAPPAQAAVSGQVAVIRNVNQSQPLAAIKGRVHSSSGPFTADYSLSWHLEKFDKPLEGRSGEVSGTLIPDGMFDGDTVPIDVPSDGLRDGTYEVAGTIEVTPTLPAGMSPVTISFSVELLIDRVGPDVFITGDRTTIHPKAPTGFTRYSPFVEIGVTGPGTTEVGFSLIVRRPGGPRLRSLQFPEAYWNGRIGSSFAAAGPYEIVAVDSRGNASDSFWSVNVVGSTFEKRTWKRTLRAGDSLVRKTVGRCSTLRRPSLRGWAGSLGLYANARCATRGAAGIVKTRHAVRIPAAALYDGVGIQSYGGAAKSRPNSFARASYVRKDGTVAGRHIAYDSYLRDHPLMRLKDTQVRSALLQDRTFRWEVEVGYDYRYDVKNFVVFVDYYVVT